MIPTGSGFASGMGLASLVLVVFFLLLPILGCVSLGVGMLRQRRGRPSRSWLIAGALLASPWLLLLLLLLGLDLPFA